MIQIREWPLGAASVLNFKDFRKLFHLTHILTEHLLLQMVNSKVLNKL